MVLASGRRRGPSGSHGFSLVGLIVTLTIVVTLSGVATLYYQSVVDDQQIAIAANELDEYSKAVRAYMLKTRKNLSPVELRLFDESYAGRVGDIPDDGYTLDFLVEAGLYREINRDPWGHIYRIDPNSATVYSLGPDPSDPTDNIIRPYSRGSGQLSGGAGEDPIPEDDIPPVISGIQPVGVIKVRDPVVRASFYDHFGGTIDQTSVKMFLDQVDLTGDSGLTTDSAGQILYQTAGGFAEGNHTVVVQVADTNGNLARREWTFTVDTNPAFVKIWVPDQGEALRGVFSPEIEAFDDTLKKVTVRLDFGDVSDRFRGVPPPDSDAAWQNQAPPQNGGGSRYRGVWANVNTELAPPTGIADGTHFFTVLAEDYSGRVISTQSQFVVDNTSPTIDLTLGVDPFAQPPTGPTSPQVISTNIVHFETRALDNIRVKEIRYWFRDPSNNLSGVRGSVTVTGSEIMVPVDWNGAPAGDWPALYNSSDELASTTAASEASYTPVTLPEGEFRFVAWAVDLAGNESARVTTNFVVNLSAAGIASLVFVDLPPGVSPSGPTDIASQTISGMDPLRYNQWSDGTFTGGVPTIETTGHLRFQLLRSDPLGTLVAEIDDHTTGPPRTPGSDGEYHVPWGPTFVGDWTVGHAVSWPMPVSTGVQFVDYPYTVRQTDVDEFGTVASSRRGAVIEYRGGQVEARVKANFNLTGQVRTEYTTFYVDTEYPIVDRFDNMVVEGPPGQFQPLPGLGWTVTELTDVGPPVIRFGGYIEDRLCNVAVGCDQTKGQVVGVWGRRFPSSTEPTLGDQNGWVQLFPHPTSNGISNIATYGAPAIQAAAGPMNLSNADPNLIDGSYAFQFKAVDAAGHTTHWQRDILVNAVGPIVTQVQINNSFDPPAPNILTQPAAATTRSKIQEPFLDLTMVVNDEVPLDRIEYSVTKIGPPEPFGATIIPVPPASPNPFTASNILVFQDQTGSVFRPTPTSYRIQIWGIAAGKRGILWDTEVEFEFLTDLAIYAPNFNGGTAVAMRQDEQAQIAQYLIDNVENVQTKAIFDHSTRVQEQGGVTDSTIQAWMSARKSDGETDVLVILDAMDWNMTDTNTGASADWGPIKDFATSSDGNVVVFTGGASPGMYVHDGASIRHTGYTDGNDKNTLYIWRDAIGLKDAGDRTKSVHSDDANGFDSQVPTVLARMLLPSLGPYRHAEIAGPNFYFITSPGDGFDEDGSDGGDWSLGDDFTKDARHQSRELLAGLNNIRENHDPEAPFAKDEGANFVLQEAGGGRFAVFYSYGHEKMGDPGNVLRTATPAAGPVIEEFIEHYLTGLAKPDAVGSTVAFTANKNTHPADPAEGLILATERDVFTWPFFDGTDDYFGVLTNATVKPSDQSRLAAAVMDMSQDGSAFLVFAFEQDDADFPLESSDGPVFGYLFRSDKTRVPLYRNGPVDQKGNPVMGRLSEDGRKAVIVGAADQNPAAGFNVVFNANNSNGTPPGGAVAWLYDLASATSPADAVAITTNAVARLPGEGTIWADVSGDGSSVAVISDTKMDPASSKVANGFAGATAMPAGEFALMVYDVGGDSYSIVNDSTQQPPVGECANFFTKVVPKQAAISSDGLNVAWLAAPTDPGCLGNQEQILISRRLGGTWYTGKVTDCPDSIDCDNGVTGFVGLDMADVGGDVPQVLFSSKGNFRNLNVGGSDLNPDQAIGADPAGGGGGPPPAPPNKTSTFTPTPAVNLAADDFEGTGSLGGGTGWAGDWVELRDGPGPPWSSGTIQIDAAATTCGSGEILKLDGAAPAALSGGGCVGYPTALACEDFETGNFSGGLGWADTQWAVEDVSEDLSASVAYQATTTNDSPGTISTRGELSVRGGVNSSACEGNNHLRVIGLSPSSDDSAAADYQGGIVRSFDVAGCTELHVRYDLIVDNGLDNGASEQFYVEVSDDGGTNWDTVQQLQDVTGSETSCNVWDTDISGFLTDGTNKKIRFRKTSGASSGSGWDGYPAGEDTLSIDNIVIYDAGGTCTSGTQAAVAPVCGAGEICDYFETGTYPDSGEGWGADWATSGGTIGTSAGGTGCSTGNFLEVVGSGSSQPDVSRQVDLSHFKSPLGDLKARLAWAGAGCEVLTPDSTTTVASDNLDSFSGCASGTGWATDWTYSDDADCSKGGAKMKIESSGSGVASCASGSYLFSPTNQAASDSIYFERDVDLPDIDVAAGDKLYLKFDIGYDRGGTNDPSDGVRVRWNGSTLLDVDANGCQSYTYDITAQENSTGVALRFGGRTDNDNDDTFSIDNIVIERYTAATVSCKSAKLQYSNDGGAGWSDTSLTAMGTSTSCQVVSEIDLPEDTTHIKVLGAAADWTSEDKLRLDDVRVYDASRTDGGGAAPPASPSAPIEDDLSSGDFTGGSGWTSDWRDDGESDGPSSGRMQVKSDGDDYGLDGDYLELTNMDESTYWIERDFNAIDGDTEAYVTWVGRFENDGDDDDFGYWSYDGSNWYQNFDLPYHFVTKRWVVGPVHDLQRIAFSTSSGENHDSGDVMRVDDIQILDGCPAGWACEPFIGGLNSGSGWAGNWTFPGSGGGGVDVVHRSSGTDDECRSGGYMDLYDLDDDTVTRDLDTAALAGGDLWITLAIDGYNDSGETMALEVQDGGGTWITLGTYSTNSGCEVYAYDIPDDAQRIRFLDPTGDQSWSGSSGDDGFRIDSIVVYDARPPKPDPMDAANTDEGPFAGEEFAECATNAICDDFEDYTLDADLHGLSEGEGWGGGWVNDTSCGGCVDRVKARNSGTSCADFTGQYYESQNQDSRFVSRTFSATRIAGMQRPVLEFDYDSQDDGSAEQVLVQITDTPGSGYVNVGVIPVSSTNGCGHFGPKDISDAALSLGGAPAEIRFLGVEPGTSDNWNSGDRYWIDNIRIYDAVPKAKPPAILRMFSTETTGGELLTFSAQYQGLTNPNTGYAIEVTKDDGASWQTLLEFPDASYSSCFATPGIALPIGSDGIRISGTGTGHTTGTDILMIDDVDVSLPGDPYAGDAADWSSDWYEVGDGRSDYGSPPNDDPNAGAFQVVDVDQCDGDEALRFQPPNDFDPSSGDEIYVEREVNLSAFTAPKLVYTRTIGPDTGGSDAFNGGSEHFEVRAHDAANVNSAAGLLREYNDLDGTEPGIDRGCVTEQFDIPTSSSSTFIRFRVYDDGSSNYETGDWIEIDDIIIKQTGGICGAEICDDWEDGDGDGDLYNNGEGWSGRWIETGDLPSTGPPPNEFSTDSMKVLNAAVDDCQADNHFRADNLFDVGGRSLHRMFDTVVFDSLSTPMLQFDAKLTCGGTTDCNENWQIDVTLDNGVSWEKVFQYDQGTFPAGGDDSTELGCQRFTVPLPPGSEGIRIGGASGGWDVVGPTGPDFLYIDNIKVIEGPGGGCGSDLVCDDFDHGQFDANDDGDIQDGGDGQGGQGWGGDWIKTNDRDDEIQEPSSGSNLCRSSGQAMEMTDRIENGRGVQRAVNLPAGMVGAPGYVLSFWFEQSTSEGDDSLEVKVYDGSSSLVTGGALITIAGNTPCRFVEVPIPSTTISNLEFNVPSNQNNSAKMWIDNVIIRRDDIGSGAGAGGSLHPQVGLYLWTGNFGSTGNQFYRVVDPQDAAAFNPRISPDGSTFVFETDADEVHGVFGFNSLDGDKDTRVVRQVVDVNDDGTLAGNSEWDGNPNSRKIFRGRFQKMSNQLFGFSSVLQLVAPLSRRGADQDLLQFTQSGGMTVPWNGYTLPVCGN